MSRKLVITVDRDNDLGVKAGIRGPVVGRKSTLTAALRLGIADPEESDTNAILGALHHHDRLVENASANDEVEIAILTGDVRVGPRSDRAIASQLDEVIQEFQPDSAILVTDGADDEASLPIITSRIRIDTVEKVIVRQSKGIEGTYYYIIKAVEDPRFRAKLLVPLSIFLMIIGLGLILPNGIALIGALPLFIGIWMLGKGLGWEQQMERLMIDMRESATGGLFSSLLWGLSIVTTLLAILLSYQKLTGPLPEGAAGSDLLLLIVLTLDDVLPWILISLFSFALSLGILRWKEGTFTGRSVLLLGLSGVIYSFADAILGVSERVLQDGEYLPEISTVSQDWSLPLLSVILYYLLKQVVQSFSDEEDMDAGNRFWGV